VGGAARAARRQEHATAIGLHSRIVELDPGHSTAWNELGEALWESKQHERSLEAFRRQVEADPFHEEAHSWLGRSHRQWGELGRAPGRGADPAGG
jgi:tetratricopeptide (TPR) repeat protein